jgi:cell division protein FtsL
VVHPKPQPPKRIDNPRKARVASESRKVRNERERYSAITRIAGFLLVVMLPLMGYVVLTSSATGLTYAVVKAQHDREALAEDDARLENRIASLRSDDRLAAIAAKLGMKEPQSFAVVKVPAATPVANAQPHFAVLSSLAGFFMPAATPR